MTSSSATEKVLGTVDPLLTELSSENDVEESRAVKTHWKDIYLVSVFYFFAYVTYQALMIPLYNYLKKIDEGASIEFYGFITSAFKIGHLVSLALFATITFVTRRYRTNLMIGRIIAIVGCVIYLFVEIAPVAYRKYLVLLVFIMHSTAEGSIIIVRSYVPRISTPADRSAAYGIKNGAVLLSIVAGPLIQLVFSSIPWPKDGVVIIDPYFKLDQYTGTIWLLLIFNILAFYLVAVHIREPSHMEGEEEDKPVPLIPSLRKAWQQLKTLDVQLILMLVLEKSISGGGFAALLTIFNPYVTTTFNYSNSHSLYIITVTSVGVGIFSIGVVALFVFAKLGTIIPASRTFPLSLILCLLMFILSYPLPLISSQVPVKSAENPDGCDVSVYAWCESLFMNPKFLWLGMIAVLTGTAMPFSLISQDTIYSRVLEGLDQNIMQAAYVMIEDVALAAVPAIATFCFKKWSPAGFWSGCAVVMVIALALWVPVYRKLRVRGI